MSGKHGTKETKEILDLGFGLVEAGKAVLADGKVTLADIAYVIPVLPKVDAAVTDAPIALKELAELDEADEADILAYAKGKLPASISDEALRAKVYAYLRVGLAFAHALSV